ncbi:hypothetical protein [Amycolatopsis sp. H20-H5]|uniref:hypothetical protein n=1 Tax=Amycolatopsis sp. H20-H5 TaxID=3046309 RepID=UPI002DBEF1D6|nr:hypothetical protein [Amycolatopsis sp. H20-H5]MEC3977719.1 hypothetical protein [Amycolatopsis sp. H20-H5]
MYNDVFDLDQVARFHSVRVLAHLRHPGRALHRPRLPPHRVFVETHAGSAAVLFAKTPFPVEVINDLDGEVTYF